MLSVERLSISDTPTNKGLLSSITQPKGEIEVSQLVKQKAHQWFYQEIPEEGELKFQHLQQYCPQFS